ncbi:type VII secretion-associated serine protease mycosin [Streptomyces sp. NPDC045456]|uniref:type VII secretion-associated serine protease mycosin n=1 Tax=Streptomyces sp. NPDC045456 TaxID=3155254 RepID=UPI003409F043
MSFTRTLRAVGGAAVAGALLFGTAPDASADGIRNDQWALRSLDAEKAWQQSTGKGITVAVIDSGVNGSHPDLKGNVLPGKNFASGDPADRETKNNHGTSMASLIAGHGHGPGNAQGVMGIAPDAKILPLKHSDSEGDTYGSSFAEPLRYAVDHGAKVVNMSIGGIGDGTDADNAAIAYAVQHDVLLVASSGNDGSANPNYPAAAPGVLAVGAVGENRRIWEDSNYGPHVLLTAPGEVIRSAAATKPYRLASGTSDAAAYVSGAAALVRAKFPDLTAGQVANRLVKSAQMPAGGSAGEGPDAHYGYGVVRPYEALTQNIPAGSKSGPLKAPTAQGQEQPSNGNANQDRWKEEEDNSNTKAAIGIAAFSLIVLAIITTIVILVKKRKKKRNGPPPGGGYGGPGGPGYYPPQQPGPYQQQGPYQQPGPYQQSGAPGGYPPPAPPNQPPGQ